MNSRRSFLKKSLGGILLMSMPSVAKANFAETKPYVRGDRKVNKFNVGIAGYSFLHFKLDETLEAMRKMDVRYLCIKDFHLPFNSTDAQIKEFHAKCAAKNIKGYAVGPIYMKSEAEIDRAFDYAKRVGVDLIVGVPLYELLPYLEKKVIETGFRYAIHNHGPDGQPYPDLEDVINRVKDLDPRIGSCLDIGHNLRFGKDPIAALLKWHKRVFDVHIKDVTGWTKAGQRTEIGRPDGLIDWPKFIRALRKVGYSGVCSLEHEKDMKDPFIGMAESIGYFKAVMDIA